MDDASTQIDATAARPPKILVVDDSPTVRETLQALLTNNLNAQVRVAPDGVRALKAVLAGDVDCVVCDVHMPVMDGMTFLRALRAHLSRFELPVLLLTGANDQEQTVRGFRAGASDFILKSCPPEELIARVQTHVELASMHRRLTREANTDSLTGLFNRRMFFQQLRAAHALHARKGTTYAVLMVDADHFKQVNDVHGHPVGDAVLMDLAAVLQHTPRTYDVSARFGGEEFIVLCPDSTAEEAGVLAERLRKEVEKRAMGGLAPGSVTISIGVADGPRNDDNGADDVLKRADSHLYAAKAGGRNRVKTTATNRVAGPRLGHVAPPEHRVG